MERSKEISCLMCLDDKGNPIVVQEIPQQERDSNLVLRELLNYLNCGIKECRIRSGSDFPSDYTIS